jgi:hypothetical protein
VATPGNGERRARFKTAVRAAFEALAVIVLAVAVVGFLVGAVLWFIASARGDGTIDIGNAFAGLGYMGAALAVLLLAVLAWRLLGVLRSPQPRALRGARKGRDDRAIITTQLAWGSALILAGAILGIVCICFIDLDDTLGGTALALATAVIGAGATLLPAGAAGSASARIQARVERPAPVAVTTKAERTSGETAGVSGTVNPLGNDVKAYFEYEDKPKAEGTPTAQSPTAKEVSAAVQLEIVEDQLTGLDPDKTYQVRLVAEAPGGVRGEGEWVELPKPG